MANKNLHLAKRLKQDEFYTQMVDIEAELPHYKDQFEDATVYCNCDDFNRSNFVKYFSNNFHDFKLDRLIATCYGDPEMFNPIIMRERGSQFEQNRYNNGIWRPMIGDGDFRSYECLELLNESHIVVTNPPFSLFREFIALMIASNKRFLVLGPFNAVSYKEIYPLIKNTQIWLGVNNGEKKFYHGDNIVSMGNVVWFTNLVHSKRMEDVPLVKEYSPEKYSKYDNYDAINVNRVKDIPADYDGEMGVPITFLDKHNPFQFEIVRFRHGDDGKDLRIDGKEPYFRIIIKRR